MIQHERGTGPAGGCRRRAADSRLPEGPLSIPPQTTDRARGLPPVRSATTGSPHRIRSISTVTRNALSRNVMHASGRVQRCDDQPAPTQRSSDISTLPASSRVFTAAQPLLDHRRKPVPANEQVVQRMYACRPGCASARSTSTGLLRGALHQYRRVIARVSSSVRAGLCPARGPDPSRQHRRAGRPLHAYPRFAATAIAAGVMLVPPAGTNRGRPDRGEQIAHRENHDRLAR